MNADAGNAKRPALAALNWFARQRSGELTTSDVRGLEVWLTRDSENQAVFRRVERTWALAGDLQDDPVILDICDKVDNAVRSRARRVAAWVGAAVISLSIAGGLVLTEGRLLRGLGWFAVAPAQEFRTAVGQQTAVTLEDGSVVTLDTDTVLRTRLSGHERRIELDRGQASFQVAKDKARPFIVIAGGKSVRATGTVFDVRVEPGRFQVTLIEGRIRVQEQGAKREETPLADMRQGWRLAVGSDALWRMEPVDIAKETSWHNGMLTFHEDPIERAVAEMNRYSRRKIVFRGTPPDAVVLGMFPAGDVDSFVDAAQVNKLARIVSRNEDQIELAAW